MMKNYFLLILLAILAGCSETEEQKTPPNWDVKKSTEFNKELALEEDLDINLFLSQHENWKVDTTGTGLRIVWFKRTEGKTPKAQQSAKVHYKISLLDGTKVYETEADKVDVFRVDNSEMESGIHEGIKLMHPGEKAKLIFPSYLAHGLVGDMDKIPPLSPLVVDIELIEIK